MCSSSCSKRSSREKRTQRYRKESHSPPKLLRCPDNRNKLVNLLMCYLLLSQAFVAAAPINPKAYSITKAAEDLSDFAQIVNGIALDQGLRDGSVDRMQMVNELLNLKVSLDVIEKENVIGLVDELNGISSAVEKGCGGSGGGQCLNTEVIEGGIGVLKQIKNLDLGKTEAALDGPLKLLVESTALYKSLRKILTNTEEALKFLSEILNVDEKNQEEVDQFVQSIDLNLQIVVKERKLFEKMLTSVKSDESTEFKLTESLDTIMNFGKTTSSISSQKNSLVSMKNELTKATSIANSVGTLVSSDKLKSVEKKMKLASYYGDIESHSSKKLTSGLFNGISDLKNIKEIKSSSVVKDVIAPHTDTASLNDLFEKVIGEGKAMEPLEKVSETQSFLSKVQPDTSRVLKTMKSSSKEVETLNSLKGLQKCIPSGEFGKPFDSKGWGGEKIRIETLSNAAEDFIKRVNLAESPYKQLSEMLNLYNSLQKADDKFKHIKNFPTLATVSKELTAFQTTLKAFKSAPWNTFAENSKISSLVRDTKTWMQTFQISNCSKAHEDFISSADAKILSISAIPNLKSDNENMKNVKMAILNLKESLEIWKKFKKSWKPTRSHSNVSIPKLDNAMELSRSLSVGVKFVRDVEKVNQYKEELKFLLGTAENGMDRQVYGNDSIRSAEIQDIWNPLNKNALKQIISYLDAFPLSRPEKLTDFQKLFNDLAKMLLPKFNGKLLSEHLSYMNSPEGIQKALKKLEELEIHETYGNRATPDAYWALPTLEKYLNLVFGKNQKRIVDDDRYLRALCYTTVIVSLEILFVCALKAYDDY